MTSTTTDPLTPRPGDPPRPRRARRTRRAWAGEDPSPARRRDALDRRRGGPWLRLARAVTAAAAVVVLGDLAL
jgi:hypothetical protein